MKQEDFILLTYKNKGKHSGQIETLIQGKKQNPYNQIKWDQVVYTKQDYPLLYELFKKQYTPKNKYVITEKELENPIIFEDSAVKEVVVNRFGTDGEITFKQAAQVTNEQLEGLFNSNTTIIKFNEFVFFTGITKISISDDDNLSKTNSPFRLSSLQEITLPETVYELGYRAFDQCNYLAKVTNIGKVRIFGMCCCQYLGSLVNNTTNEVITIKEFKGTICHFFNTSLPKEIIIEEGITEIPDQSFAFSSTNFKNIKKITLPSTLKRINNAHAFQLQTITEINLPDGLEYIGENSFISCYYIKEMNIPNSVETIGHYAFKNMTSLEKINFPENPKFNTITNQVLNGCKKLKVITIPANVTTIEGNAFQNCTGLKEIYIKATTPPTLANANAFTGVTAKIYVPLESVETYKTASVWSGFADRIFGIEEETN